MSTLTRCRAMTAAKRSGGETGEPSRRTEGVRLSRAAEIMYAWPVIQPGVAITSSTSPVEGGAALAAAAVEAAASGLSLAVAKPATGGEAAGAALGGASGAGALGGAAGRSSAIALVAHSPSWKPACEWTIPFGLPVEPDVYKTRRGCDALRGNGAARAHMA